jgi:hypothetical protein
MQRQRRKLTVEDRVAIDLRRKDGWGVRAIARELGRSPSVISTEIGRGREPDGTYHYSCSTHFGGRYGCTILFRSAVRAFARAQFAQDAYGARTE